MFDIFEQTVTRFVKSVNVKDKILTVILDNDCVIENKGGKKQGNVGEMIGISSIFTWVYADKGYFSYHIQIFLDDENYIGITVDISCDTPFISFYLENLNQGPKYSLEYDGIDVCWNLRIRDAFFGELLLKIDDKEIPAYYKKFMN
jgi:hypothetical protein